MIWVWAIFLVLSPAILYVLLGVAVSLKDKYFPRRCPTCNIRALHSVNFIKATILVNGRRAPDCWEYLLCTSCRKPFKLHHGKWEDVSAEEFKQFFSPS